MKITKIEPVIVHINHRGDWVFVLLHTNDGLTGLGEASHSGDDALLVYLCGQLEKKLVGENPLRIEAIWNNLRKENGGRVYNTVLSGIEQALWDLMGKHLDVPIRTLFGGEVRDSLRLYANINRHITNRSAEGFVNAAVKAVEDGFTAIKIAPFDEVAGPSRSRTGSSATWRKGVERVKAVRSAIGRDIELAVDCHGRMDVSEAKAAAAELAECDLLWYEEPVSRSSVEGLRSITEDVPMATAACECLFSLEEFRPFLTRRIVDVIMPDVKHDGGLLETKHIARAARMNEALIAPHNPAGPVSTAAAAQVMSTVSNFSILEYAWGEVDWRADLIDPPERIKDGYLLLPDGPGLGHHLSEETLELHQAQTSDR
jgi:galactonate dehydratase